MHETRLVSSHGGNVEWLVGLYYLDRLTHEWASISTSESYLDSQGIDYSGLQIAPGTAGVSIDPNERNAQTDEAAFFAEITYRFTETLSLTAGMRYTEYEFWDRQNPEGSISNILDLIGTGGGVATSTPDPLAFISTGKESATTAKFSINWQPNDDQTFYFTAAQGFLRGHPNVQINGGVSLIDPTDTIIPPGSDADELWNYELGAKTRWLDGRLQANVAAYFIDWSDIQVALTRRSDGAPYSGNSGDVESKGIEAELLYLPNANLELGLNLTFASKEIVSLTQTQAIQTGLRSRR